ncbi:putative Calcium/calmodulin-dependent protein kinase [Burkholderiales bacterium]|nr:putative Calcium/calmodulin-dependent protein kinase [Burkholderiales bacterium]
MVPEATRPRILEPGQIVDGFCLVERLHRGGMAALWHVTRADLAVAGIMKIPLLGEDPTAIVGFEVEQMILPLLHGPHVPRWIAAGGFDAQPYIVMEMIQGQSLRARLEQTPLPAPEVAAIGARIAEALHDLHQQQVIHHDIKPSNIMFRADGTAVLIDFGLARHDRLPDLLAEQFRLPMGTGPYISPEQVLHNRTDARSDLFALGVILYFLATGARPFGAPTSVRGLRRRLYEEPAPPRAHRPEFPLWLQEIILHCLEVDPEQRYATAAQLAFDLTHPQSVALTARASAAQAQSPWTRLGRLVRRLAAKPTTRSTTQQLNRAPIVMAAVDLTQEWEALADALRTAARHVLQAAPGARLACVSVLRTHRLRCARRRRGHAPARASTGTAATLGAPAGAAGRSRELSRARGPRSSHRDPRLCARQPGRPHRHWFARGFVPATLSGQRFHPGRGPGRLYRHRRQGTGRGARRTGRSAGAAGRALMRRARRAAPRGPHDPASA